MGERGEKKARRMNGRDGVRGFSMGDGEGDEEEKERRMGMRMRGGREMRVLGTLLGST